MVEGSNSSGVTKDSVFTHESLPLLSGMSEQAIGKDTAKDIEKLKFMIKINDAICAAKSIQGSKIQEIFNQHLSAPKGLFKPLAIVGPSGAGKGTLMNKVFEKYRDRFGFSVSYTTRPPREGEINGVHYHFVDHATFQSKIERDEFIEYCQVHTNLYGSEKAQIDEFKKQKLIALFDIDIQGAKKIHAIFPETNFIFVCPPSISELHSRLLKRNTDKPEVIAKRVENATGEIAECIELWHMFKHRILNKDLERSSQEFVGVIEALYEEELGLKKE